MGSSNTTVIVLDTVPQLFVATISKMLVPTINDCVLVSTFPTGLKLNVVPDPFAVNVTSDDPPTFMIAALIVTDGIDVVDGFVLG